MRVVHSIHALERERQTWNGLVGLVPTMGYLHAGHLALMRQARAENQVLVASIFVNPTQFGPHEDLARYPRDLKRDLQLLETVGVDVVFAPTAEEMYPAGFATYVEIQGPLSTEAEGALRPNHFRGVATVVLKLFQLIQPQWAYFGQKDAQQVMVISRMVSDFHLSVRLRIGSTIREEDGLAMSSRNSYLDPVARAAAPVLYHALQAGQTIFDSHMSEHSQAVIQAMRDVIVGEPRARLDYAEVRSATTFLPLETLQPPALLLIAAHIGSTRLIDTFTIHSNGSWDTGVPASHLTRSLEEQQKDETGQR